MEHPPGACQVKVMSNREFDQRFVKKTMIGSGTFGRVWKTFDNDSQKEVAIKKIDKFSTGKLGVSMLVIREVSFLRQLDHPNITKVREILLNRRCWQNSNALKLVMDLASMDLAKFISRKNCKLSLEQVKLMSKQILEGLAYLHSHLIMHRDLKPNNILIDERTLVPKITDFGCARTFALAEAGKRSYSWPIQNTYYAAPEILLGCREYTPAIDVWSYGCVLMEMLRGDGRCLLFDEGASDDKKKNKNDKQDKKNDASHEEHQHPHPAAAKNPQAVALAPLPCLVKNAAGPKHLLKPDHRAQLKPQQNLQEKKRETKKKVVKKKVIIDSSSDEDDSGDDAKKKRLSVKYARDISVLYKIFKLCGVPSSEYAKYLLTLRFTREFISRLTTGTTATATGTSSTNFQPQLQPQPQPQHQAPAVRPAATATATHRTAVIPAPPRVLPLPPQLLPPKVPPPPPPPLPPTPPPSSAAVNRRHTMVPPCLAPFSVFNAYAHAAVGGMVATTTAAATATYYKITNQKVTEKAPAPAPVTAAPRPVPEPEQYRLPTAVAKDIPGIAAGEVNINGKRPLTAAMPSTTGAGHRDDGKRRITDATAATAGGKKVIDFTTATTTATTVADTPTAAVPLPKAEPTPKHKPVRDVLVSSSSAPSILDLRKRILAEMNPRLADTDAASMLVDILCIDPNNRIKAKDALNHRFFVTTVTSSSSSSTECEKCSSSSSKEQSMVV